MTEHAETSIYDGPCFLTVTATTYCLPYRLAAPRSNCIHIPDPEIPENDIAHFEDEVIALYSNVALTLLSSPLISLPSSHASSPATSSSSSSSSSDESYTLHTLTMSQDTATVQYQGSKNLPGLTPETLSPQVLLQWVQQCTQFFCNKGIAEDRQVAAAASGLQDAQIVDWYFSYEDEFNQGMFPQFMEAFRCR
ncbi:hypothetical protein NM688_g8130 [Phlebia brevispora]|uniref:Uncharacterized protein n=1 Tax=Phlebia brevispora TaxID=194682 RepID=A0ACC1RX05_9APHY|nr:hypothetical protein NM688_g8130 [Phlebia brevispora]